MSTTVRSLAFRALDRQVIAGRADDAALVTADQTWTYAQLLHDSAALAAGLRDLGAAGQGVALESDLGLAPRLLSVLAVIRLAGSFDDSGPWRIAGDPATVSTIDQNWAFDIVLSAGRIDPAAALARDPEGYEAEVMARHGDLLEVLITGGTVRMVP